MGEPHVLNRFVLQAVDCWHTVPLSSPPFLEVNHSRNRVEHWFIQCCIYDILVRKHEYYFRGWNLPTLELHLSMFYWTVEEKHVVSFYDTTNRFEWVKIHNRQVHVGVLLIIHYFQPINHFLAVYWNCMFYAAKRKSRRVPSDSHDVLQTGCCN